jgi:opacity protein-like surface antigen
MKKLLAIALLSGAAAAPALAQSSHYYGAVDYGTVNMSGPGSYSSPDALTASVGYRYLPNVSFEGGVTLVGSATATTPPGGGRVSVSQTIVSAVAVGLVPINRDFSLFGKAGVGVHNGEINGLPDDLVLGFGGQFQINPKVSARAQYEILGKAKIPTTSDKADMTRLSIGAIVNF